MVLLVELLIFWLKSPISVYCDNVLEITHQCVQVNTDCASLAMNDVNDIIDEICLN